MKSHAKVVIVGGGIMGAGLLYHLAEAGWTDVVLVEKGELTSGSTWHAAGQCPSFTVDFNMAKIHQYGNTLYPKLEEMTGQYVGWHGAGGLRLALSKEEVDWFRYVHGISKAIGYRMEVIGPDEIKQVNPFLDTTGVLAAAWTKDDGHVDPAGLCNAFAIGAKNMGAEIYRHNRVLDINALPSGEWEVVTEQGNIVAEHIVNAAGCYAREIGAMVGVQVPITNVEHQYLVTEPLKELQNYKGELPVMRDPYTAGYYRQEQKAGLVGIYEHTGIKEAWAESGGSPEWASENELFQEDIDRISPWLEAALERMPIFANAGIKRVVNGAIPHSPDGNPLLGPAAGAKNFWMCCGSSIGIAQGGGCGKYLAQWMIEGQAEINMHGFDPRRFGPYADADYTRSKSFQDYRYMFITHLPGEERPDARPARPSTLYEKLKAKGCVHTEAFGWERPKWFSPDGREEECGYRNNNIFDLVGKECKAVRERVGVMDMSSFAKYEVSGSDAEAFLNRVCANRMPRKLGRIGLAHMLTKDGRIESEITATRIADDTFYILAGAAAELHDLDMLQFQVAPDESVTIRNVTDDLGMLVLTGPKSRDVLSAITEAALDNAAFPWLSAREISVAGVPVRALRVSYVGELGWELHIPMEKLVTVYDAVWAAGEAHGIADFGSYTMNSLRMEKAYRGWGSELTAEITMIEADMERFVNFKKGDFVGRDALLKVKEQGVSTQLVYAEVDVTDNTPRGNEPVLVGDRCIGIVTSGAHSYQTGKALIFAYVDPKFATAGAEFDIELLSERHKAKVIANPVYDADSSRMRV